MSPSKLQTNRNSQFEINKLQNQTVNEASNRNLIPSKIEHISYNNANKIKAQAFD